MFQDPSHGQAERNLERTLHELVGDHDPEVTPLFAHQRQPDFRSHFLLLNSNETRRKNRISFFNNFQKRSFQKNNSLYFLKDFLIFFQSFIWCHDTWYNDTVNNDTQHSSNQNND